MADYLKYLESASFKNDFLNRKEEAFKALFDTFYEELYALSHQIIRSDLEAEDVVVVAFAALFQNPDKFVDYSNRTGKELKHLNFKWYLAEVVRNHSLDRIKVNSRRAKREQVYHMMIATDYGLENALREKEAMQALLDHALSQLPGQCQEVVKLTYITGLKYEEVATKMGVSINTVKKQLKRGKDQLRSIVRSRPSHTLWNMLILSISASFLTHMLIIFQNLTSL